jgi:NADPH:quinone reductase-like Zn-dependent oxidoreductase
MTRAVTYRHGGEPADLLELTDVEDPEAPGRGQVQVQVTLFPIHPGDLLAVSHARLTDGYVIAGAEATGMVTAVGPGATDISPGSRVTFFPHPGAWRETVNADAATVVPVPDSLPDTVAAQMLCNPLTALQLRRAAESHHSVGYEGVVLNNAAASSVGRLFTAGAEHHHINTISIVRSDQRARELAERFPTVPVVSTARPDWVDQVRDAAAGRPIPVVLDPVGGSAAGHLLSLLSAGGSLILYGQLEQGAMGLHASTMVSPELSIRGLSIGRWLSVVSAEQRAADVASALSIAQNLRVAFDTAAIYPLDQIGEAARHASRPGKVGTVLVKP